MNAYYSDSVMGRTERTIYRFSIIGYLFGRELWRKTFYCDDRARGLTYAEWYLKNQVANIACDRYRVELFNGDDTRTLMGGPAPEEKDPWKADSADIMATYSNWDTTFKAAVNQAGWKERLGVSRVRSAAMRVGVGAGRH